MNKQKQDTIKHNCKLSEENSKVSTISILANSSNSIYSKALVSFDFIYFNELNKNFETLSCLKFYTDLVYIM